MNTIDITNSLEKDKLVNSLNLQISHWTMALHMFRTTNFKKAELNWNQN